MNENKISIKRYEQAADPRVSLGGIKWEKKWDVCVQCDSREEAEALRTALAQPKKEWVGLTDEEIRNIATQGRTDFSRPPYEEYYIAIEQALKEKNT
jgi:hypothetical protein